MSRFLALLLGLSLSAGCSRVGTVEVPAGTPNWGFLGVSLEGDPDVKGVVIIDVLPKSSASDAGLRNGDVIIQIDGQSVVAKSDVESITKARQPNEVVLVRIERGGIESDVSLRLMAHGEITAILRYIESQKPSPQTSPEKFDVAPPPSDVDDSSVWSGQRISIPPAHRTL